MPPRATTRTQKHWPRANTSTQKHWPQRPCPLPKRMVFVRAISRALAHIRVSIGALLQRGSQGHHPVGKPLAKRVFHLTTKKKGSTVVSYHRASETVDNVRVLHLTTKKRVRRLYITGCKSRRQCQSRSPEMGALTFVG